MSSEEDQTEMTVNFKTAGVVKMLKFAPPSAAIEYILYSPELKILGVQFAPFKGGGQAFYKDVPEKELEALLAADSAGAYFNKNIRNHYATQA